jgi:alkanesulfonate monooxygenase SsuD/methylene tetrahydromethanopterin reductase-like flavin-dependent oxidoreductase (luciferase family)
MTDYGHDLEFGYFLIPDAGDPRGVLETARLADRLGYDLLAVQDHPYQPAHLDTLVLLGVILGQTRRIRVFQDVGNLPLRPPAAFAKAAATLDLLSGGRFEAGLGGGGFLEAAHAMGAPARTGGESALALTGRKADGWAAPLMNYLPPADAADAQEVIDSAARAAGRDPSLIRRIYNVPGAFTAEAPGPARDTDKTIVGPPEHWAAVLTQLALELGFGTFILTVPPDPDALRTFIEEVAPEVRERVAAARAQASSEPAVVTSR